MASAEDILRGIDWGLLMVISTTGKVHHHHGIVVEMRFICLS